MFSRLAITSLLLAGLMACGASAKTARARSGLDAYLIALRGDDPRPIYEMLTKEQRDAVTYEEWAKRWTESTAERELQASQIEDSLRVQQAVDEDASLRFEDGRTITLARAPSGWRLNQALVGRTKADTPEDALTIFSAALRERDIEGVFGILSKRRRSSFETQLRNFSHGLEEGRANAESSPFLLNKERAELAWNFEGTRYKVVLRKEEGEWYIDDIHIGPDPTVDPDEAEADASRPPLELLRRRK
jgi:hypothetical protein